MKRGLGGAGAEGGAASGADRGLVCADEKGDDERADGGPRGEPPFGGGELGLARVGSAGHDCEGS